MTTATKKRIVASVLIATAAWPLVHGALVWRYGIDPWEFFGWAMYALPNSRVQARVDRVVDGHAVSAPISTRTAANIKTFAQRRAVLGTLASPENFAESMLSRDRHLADAEGVEVVVRTWRLDRDSARFGYVEERTRVLR